jgi:Lipid A 3-O-deacylase (PagL).
MRNKLIIILFLLIANKIGAQTADQFSFKLQGVYGHIIPHDEHVKALILNPVSGAEFSVEFQTMNDKPWHQFTSFPIFGVGSVWLNLGNQTKLGNAFAIYPYLCFPLIRTNHLKLNIKAGAGISYLTKTYFNTNKDSLGNLLPLNSTNAAISSNLNVYLSGGGNLEIPIGKGLSLTADYTWNHMSNGSVVVPNSGLNLLNGFIGLKYFPNYKKFSFPSKHKTDSIPRKFCFEIIAAGGLRQYYYLDQKTYPIASLNFSIYRPLTNYYRMGLGIDAFYDGVYDGTSLYKKVYLKTNELKNKIRIGISWQHELLFGRLTAGFDFGLYLYDPLKNLSPVNVNTGELIYPNQQKPLIYSYNINKNGIESGEDGWFYTRAKLKYAISQHIFASIGIKTHLQKAEFIEWGLGYRF